MTRKEVTKLLALKHNASADKIDDILDDFFGIIGITLAQGQDVKLTNFGKFEARRHPAGIRRNPRTGEQVKVGPRISVGFRPAVALKTQVNDLSQI